MMEKICSLLMLKVNLNNLDKMTNYGAEDDPDRKVTANFALYSAAGTKSGAVVYFELEPGKELGTHTDSAEEIVYVIDGTIEAITGNDNNEGKDRLSRGKERRAWSHASYGVSQFSNCRYKYSQGYWVLFQSKCHQYI